MNVIWINVTAKGERRYLIISISKYYYRVYECVAAKFLNDYFGILITINSNQRVSLIGREEKRHLFLTLVDASTFDVSFFFLIFCAWILIRVWNALIWHWNVFIWNWNTICKNIFWLNVIFYIIIIFKK